MDRRGFLLRLVEVPAAFVAVVSAAEAGPRFVLQAKQSLEVVWREGTSYLKMFFPDVRVERVQRTRRGLEADARYEFSAKGPYQSLFLGKEEPWHDAPLEEAVALEP